MTTARAYAPSPRTLRTLLGLAGAGGIIFLIGLLVEPAQAWAGYLIGFHFVMGLALIGAAFVAILSLAGAKWAGVAAHVPRIMAERLPLAAGLGLVLCLGIPSLYEWSNAVVVEGDALLQHKKPWLNTAGFVLRLVIYFGVWIFATRMLLARARSYDSTPGSRRGPLLRAASIFMALFAIGFSLACVDWLESLDPHWFSTIFTLYVLAGLGVSGIACTILLVVVLRRSGALGEGEHKELLDDLGKIALGLSVFWAYIWYCQYMLIWYTNMPEETGWYALRMSEPWRALTPASLALNWLVPFLALMPRRMRRSETALIRIALVMLVGHALDLYLVVGPAVHAEESLIGLWEVGPIVGCLALFVTAVLRGLGRSEAPAG